jgi:hypothetical protein
MSRRNISQKRYFRSPLIRFKTSDLGTYFSVDAEGNWLTLGQYIELHGDEEREGGSTMERLTAAPRYAPERSSSNSKIDVLVNQYLAAMEDQVLEIVGHGSYNATQLRDEVDRHTVVGKQFIDMILADHVFVEEAIRQGDFTVNE